MSPRRPWAELPQEITAAFLQKLGAVELLTAAQSVCKAWYSVCLDPSLWRSIDMRTSDWGPCDVEEMCRKAVDRSQGQLIDINIPNFCTGGLLLYISQRSSQLRRLQIEHGDYVTDDAMIEAVKHFPLLEELHLYYSPVEPQTIKAIGRSCPLLNSFTLNNFRDKYQAWNGEARAVAKSMPELRRLQLVGNKMTNVGLQCILDGCPHLELLDLRHCSNVDLGTEIGLLCAERIRDLKRPHDSFHDYPFEDEVRYCDDDDDDDDVDSCDINFWSDDYDDDSEYEYDSDDE